MFGMPKEKAHSQYGYERIGILNYSVVNIPGVPENGIAIQEWLNRHLETEHICIVSKDENLRPLKEYVVKPLFFYRNVCKMLKKPYVNKMHDMVASGNMRKHF